MAKKGHVPLRVLQRRLSRLAGLVYQRQDRKPRPGEYPLKLLKRNLAKLDKLVLRRQRDPNKWK